MRKLYKSQLEYTKNGINIQKFVIIIIIIIIMPSLTKKIILTDVKVYKIIAYMQVNVL